jgi:hypothetical protein
MVCIHRTGQEKNRTWYPVMAYASHLKLNR